MIDKGLPHYYAMLSHSSASIPYIEIIYWFLLRFRAAWFTALLKIVRRQIAFRLPELLYSHDRPQFVCMFIKAPSISAPGAILHLLTVFAHLDTSRKYAWMWLAEWMTTDCKTLLVWSCALVPDRIYDTMCSLNAGVNVSPISRRIRYLSCTPAAYYLLIQYQQDYSN